MAKEQKPEQDPVPGPDAPEEQGPPKSYRLYIALAIVALILFQTIVLAVALRSWFPPPAQANMGLDPVNNAGAGLDDVPIVPQNIGKKEEFIEKMINEGKAIRTKKALDDGMETFSVVVSVTVRTKEDGKFTTRYEACQNRIKDKLESMLEGSSAGEREEVGLTAIKARAKKIINDELEVPYVQEVLMFDNVYEKQ